MRKMEYKGNKNIVGGRLRAARREAGLTQGELAARLQVLEVAVDQQSLSKMERNLRMVTDYELFYIAKALKKDVNWFFQA